MTTTRRTFMAGTAALAAFGATPLVSASRAAGRPAGEDADVIVVGAGMAGLNTAHLLEQQGLKVIVLEGRQRVGGRVFTLFDEPGYPEMGFNTFAAGYGRGLDAARRTGTVLEEQNARLALGGPHELVLGGQVIKPADWPTHPANPFPEPFRDVMPYALFGKLMAERNPLKDWMNWTDPANAPLDIPVYEWLKAQGLNDAAIRLAFDVAPYHGDSARDVSALMYEFGDGWTKAQMNVGMTAYAVKGGNMKLPIAMARALKGDILMGRQVVGVSSSDTGASVTCADGTSLRAGRVVLALPFSTVRKIRFDPGLEGLQDEAVRTLGYQAISILFVRVESPYWEEDGLGVTMWTDGLPATVIAQRFGSTPEEVTGLMVQARGNMAHRWDAMDPQDLKRQVIAGIEQIRPAARGKLRATYLQRWALDPFNQGDWAVWLPGQITRFAQVMAQPAGRIHFAGEHTATENRGLEGALESSERVALEVLLGS